jgi:hypothetical protein
MGLVIRIAVSRSMTKSMRLLARSISTEPALDPFGSGMVQTVPVGIPRMENSEPPKRRSSISMMPKIGTWRRRARRSIVAVMVVSTPPSSAVVPRGTSTPPAPTNAISMALPSSRDKVMGI